VPRSDTQQPSLSESLRRASYEEFWQWQAQWGKERSPGRETQALADSFNGPGYRERIEAITLEENSRQEEKLREYDASLTMRIPCLYTTDFDVRVNDDGETELLIHRPHGFAVILVLQDSPLMFKKLLDAIETGIRVSGLERRMKGVRKKIVRREPKPMQQRKSKPPSKPISIGTKGGPSIKQAAASTTRRYK
jgi:hypothetical protein